MALTKIINGTLTKAPLTAGYYIGQLMVLVNQTSAIEQVSSSTLLSLITSPTSVAPGESILCMWSGNVWQALGSSSADVLSAASYGMSSAASAATNKAALEAAIAVAATGSGLVYIPAGDYTFNLSALTGSDHGLIAIPSNVTIFGDGYNTILRITGLNGGAGADAGRNLLYFGQNCKNSTVRGVRFIGANGVDATGFTFVENNESAAVHFRADNTQENCTVEDCWFQNLYGFLVHSPGTVTNCRVQRNYGFWCANGINVNGFRTNQSFNQLYQCEGFECTGADNIFESNILTDCLGSAGFSIGGEQVVGYVHHGNVVRGNQINGMTKPSAQSVGILIGNAAVGTLVHGNSIRACTGGALLIGVTDLVGAVSYGCVVTGNICLNNSNNSTDVYQVILAGGGKHLFIGNTVRVVAESSDGRESGLGAQMGVVISSDNNIVVNNIIGGKTSNYSLVEQNGVAGNTLNPNRFVDSANQVAWGSGTTQDAETRVAAVATDLLYQTRVALETNKQHKVYASGKMEWGSGSAAPDVSLSRESGTLTVTGDTSSPAKAGFRLTPQDAEPTGPNVVGDLYVTTAGLLYICTTAGTPGTWTKVGAQ